MDREADIFTLVAQMQARGQDFIIRAKASSTSQRAHGVSRDPSEANHTPKRQRLEESAYATPRDLH